MSCQCHRPDRNCAECKGHEIKVLIFGAKPLAELFKIKDRLDAIGNIIQNDSFDRDIVVPVLIPGTYEPLNYQDDTDIISGLRRMFKRNKK